MNKPEAVDSVRLQGNVMFSEPLVATKTTLAYALGMATIRSGMGYCFVILARGPTSRSKRLRKEWGWQGGFDSIPNTPVRNDGL